jgi:hypothetical protein
VGLLMMTLTLVLLLWACRPLGLPWRLPFL